MEREELEKKLKHCAGRDCTCCVNNSWESSWECSCNADWTPEIVYKQQFEIDQLHARIEKARKILTNSGFKGYPAIIAAAIQELSDEKAV